MKIAAYCRVSTDKNEQIDSMIHQKEFFSEYATRNGHELFRLYADEGISGTSLKKREEFKRLMHDAESGMFQMVVVKDISRFARNTVDALQSIRTLKSLGITTLFLTANMDSMGDSEFILTLFSAMAQEESNNLSKRVKWGKRINAEKGRVPLQLFGYDRIDNFTLSINEREADIVRRIFALYTEQGLGCRTISITLNANCDKTKFGNDWNPRGVRRILTNPIYCGILINHKYEVEDFLTGKQISLPPDQQFIHDRPGLAIISRDMFQRTQKIMADRREKYSTGYSFAESRYSNRHIFSTLIKCPHCGRSFCRKTYTYRNTRNYWKCVTNDQYTAEHCNNTFKLEEPELLDQLHQYFTAMIADRDAFQLSVLNEVRKYLSKQTPFLPTKKDITTKRERLLFKKERYQELFANGLITISELQEKITQISQEIKDIDHTLALASRSSQHTHDYDTFCQMYRSEIEQVLEFKTLTNLDMRQLINHISASRDAAIGITFNKLQDCANSLPI